jgi:hypothetical protein
LTLIENVAKEAKEQNVKIEIWPLVSRSEQENFESPFFEKFASGNLSEFRFQDSAEMEDYLEYVVRGTRSFRPTYHLPLHILRDERDPPIMIDWFPIVQLAKRPGKIPILDETKQ